MILNADNLPTYHLTSVVDNHELEITHVLLDTKWANFQTLHETIYAAFGWDSPAFVYVPELVNTAGQSINSLSEEWFHVEYLFTQGYLPEAVFNYLALISWHPQQQDEVLSPDELLESFEIERLRSTPGIYDPKRLDWFNQQHIQRKSLEELTDLVMPRLLNAYPDQEILRSRAWTAKLVDCVRDSLVTLSEVEPRTRFAFYEPEPYSDSARAILARPGADQVLRWLRDALPQEGELEIDVVEDVLRDLRKSFKDRPGWGGQQVNAPVIAALTNMSNSLMPERVLALLGAAVCRRRIERVLSLPTA